MARPPARVACRPRKVGWPGQQASAQPSSDSRRLFKIGISKWRVCKAPETGSSMSRYAAVSATAPPCRSHRHRHPARRPPLVPVVPRASRSKGKGRVVARRRLFFLVCLRTRNRLVQALRNRVVQALRNRVAKTLKLERGCLRTRNEICLVIKSSHTPTACRFAFWFHWQMHWQGRFLPARSRSTVDG